MLDEKNVNDELDIEENEELEANETDDAPDTEENEADAEAEQVEDDDTDDEDDGDSDAEERRARAKAHIDRLKEENRKLKAQLEKSSQKGSQKSDSQESVASNELVSRTFLATKGYDNEAIQDKAIERAERLGMSVDQLLRDPDEKAVLDNAVKRMTAKSASARPTGKGGTKQRDAKWYADNNVMPDDPKLRAEVWDILAERDR